MPEEARRLANSVEYWYRDKYGLTGDDPRFTATYGQMLTEFYAEQIRLGFCCCKCGTWFKGDFCHDCGARNEWRPEPRTCLNEKCKHKQTYGKYCTECGTELPEPISGMPSAQQLDFGVIDAPIIADDQIIAWRKEDEDEGRGPDT